MKMVNNMSDSFPVSVDSIQEICSSFDNMRRTLFTVVARGILTIVSVFTTFNVGDSRNNVALL